jgi:hypothetical protein
MIRSTSACSRWRSFASPSRARKSSTYGSFVSCCARSDSPGGRTSAKFDDAACSRVCAADRI